MLWSTQRCQESHAANYATTPKMRESSIVVLLVSHFQTVHPNQETNPKTHFKLRISWMSKSTKRLAHGQDRPKGSPILFGLERTRPQGNSLKNIRRSNGWNSRDGRYSKHPPRNIPQIFKMRMMRSSFHLTKAFGAGGATTWFGVAIRKNHCDPRALTCPTNGKGNSSSQLPLDGICQFLGGSR